MYLQYFDQTNIGGYSSSYSWERLDPGSAADRLSLSKFPIDNYGDVYDLLRRNNAPSDDTERTELIRL